MNYTAFRVVLLVVSVLVSLSPCGAQTRSVFEGAAREGGSPLDYRALDIETLRKHFARPPMRARPFVIWFWFSNDVTRDEVTRELEEMRRVGIGGVEIRIIDDVVVTGSSKPEPRIRYLSDAWLTVFEHVCAEAKRLDMVVGLNPGMGWIYGGPWITKEHQARKLEGAETVLEGPVQLDAMLPVPVRREVVAVRAFAWALDETGTGKVVSPETFVDLTAQIVQYDDAKDAYYLRWNVPAGKWLLGTFSEWVTGRPDHVRSPGGAGRSFDPFSVEAARIQWENVVLRIQERTGQYFGTTVTEIATDSWEYGANWTPRFAEIFRDRLDYDLVPRLYATLGYGPEEKRIRDDFKRISQEILVENFFIPITRWCHEAGLLHRPQAYGHPHNNLFDAYFHSDIPEIEQGTRPPQAAWVAHTCGKPLVSSEALTFFGGSRATMDGMRKEVNGAFADGINRIDFHSWSYSPPKAGVPGWRMYVPFHINRTVAWFPFAEHLNTWIARSQWLLQAGGAVAEAVAFGCDLPTEGTPYPVDAVNETTLDCLRTRDGKVPYDFKFLVLEGDVAMDVRLRVAELLESGTRVLWKQAPASWETSALGGAPGETRTADVGESKRLVELFDALEQQGRIRRVDDPWRVVAESASVTWDVAGRGASLRYLHRRVKGGEIFFVVNRSRDEVAETEFTFKVDASMVPEVWDADSGTVAQATLYRRLEDGVVLPARLGPLEHWCVVFSDRPEGLHAVRSDSEVTVHRTAAGLHADVAESGDYSVSLSDGTSRTFAARVPEAVGIVGPWRLGSVATRGADLDARASIEPLQKLVSWSEIPALATYLGTATYTTTFDVPKRLLESSPRSGLEPGLPSGLKPGLALDLGDVRHVARVWVNDRLVGTAWHRPYRLAISPDGLRETGNTLRVEVANLEYFLKEQQPSGLLGPVLIRGRARVALEKR